MTRVKFILSKGEKPQLHKIFKKRSLKMFYFKSVVKMEQFGEEDDIQEVFFPYIDGWFDGDEKQQMFIEEEMSKMLDIGYSPLELLHEEVVQTLDGVYFIMSAPVPESDERAMFMFEVLHSEPNNVYMYIVLDELVYQDWEPGEMDYRYQFAQTEEGVVKWLDEITN